MRPSIVTLILLTLCAGCQMYVVPDEAANRVRAIDPDQRRSVWVPAERDSHDVEVRGDQLRILGPSDRPGWQRARTLSPAIPTGVVFMGFAAAFVAGSIPLLLNPGPSPGGLDVPGDRAVGGFVLAGMAGAHAIVGSVLLIVGGATTKRHERRR